MKNKIYTILFLFLLGMSLIACNGQENVAEGQMKCTFSIECSKAVENKDQLTKEAAEAVPEDGIILEAQEVTFSEGESVYDILTRVCREHNILMESSFTPGTGSAYIEGIANLYEFDCGKESGWMFCVNGEFPGLSCSDIKVKEGDIIEIRYTCNLGKDWEREVEK